MHSQYTGHTTCTGSMLEENEQLLKAICLQQRVHSKQEMSRTSSLSPSTAAPGLVGAECACQRFAGAPPAYIAVQTREHDVLTPAPQLHCSQLGTDTPCCARPGVWLPSWGGGYKAWGAVPWYPCISLQGTACITGMVSAEAIRHKDGGGAPDAAYGTWGSC